MAKIRKNEIVDQVSASGSVSKKQINEIIEQIQDIIVNELKSGNDVNLPKIGTFKPVNKPARMGINPKTKDKIEIPARNSVNFKTAKVLKEHLN